MDFRVIAMTAQDWPEVRKIYRQGIVTGHATFETEVPDWEKWDRGHLKNCRLVARDSKQILGWAALSPVSTRKVYAGVAEVSIYVSSEVRGAGIGKSLLTTLVHESERGGLWTLQAGIFPENLASLALHRSCGFREVGIRERLGRMAGAWRNVILMERRSPRVGL